MCRICYCCFLLFFFSLKLQGQVSDTSRVSQGLSDSLQNQVEKEWQNGLSAEKQNLNGVLSPFSKPDPKLHGSVTLQGFTTNVQSPMRMNAPTYLRLYGNSTITMFSLPFNLQGYYTTEQNNLYNPNYLRWSFDANQFKRNLELQAREQAKAAGKKYEDKVKLNGQLETEQKN